MKNGKNSPKLTMFLSGEELQEFYDKLGHSEYRTNWLITRWCIHGEIGVKAAPDELLLLNEGTI